MTKGLPREGFPCLCMDYGGRSVLLTGPVKPASASGGTWTGAFECINHYCTAPKHASSVSLSSRMQRAQGSPLNRSCRLCFKWVGGQVGGLPWPVSEIERFGAVLMGRYSCLRRLHRSCNCWVLRLQR